MNINFELNRLIRFGLKKKLFEEFDIDYVGNKLVDLLQLPEFEFEPIEENLDSPTEVLENILDFVAEKGILEHNTVEYRDLLDTKMMDCLMPRPSEIICQFERLYKQSPKAATDYYYYLSQASNYIRTTRVAKDKRWKIATSYGTLEISINLSKPEKDPKMIAMAKSLPSSNYPKCLLCKENVGYAGHLNHPARQNHRIIPLNLVQEEWYLQYSPYVYYNEHCIILKNEHEPMKISRVTFERLLDFISQFKHYFVGSNADLPIVGGSILNHDHFQGGSHVFAMEVAKPLKEYAIPGYEGIKVEFLKWPLSVLRLKGINKEFLVELGDLILDTWRGYSDETLGIRAYTNETPHHTVTPIARFKDNHYELDLVLRDNRTSAKHPDGVFHPHAHLHHLKKENIGLIEVMGLAVLPGRLKDELEVVRQALVSRDEAVLMLAGLEKHISWLQEMLACHGQVVEVEADSIIQKEIGLKFVEILECCGVYKLNEEGLAGVDRFIACLSNM